MTGDGVNDALALKKPTSESPWASSGRMSRRMLPMILLDDRFASIVSASVKGRTIFQQSEEIRHYVFTSNASELFTVLLGFLFHIPMPITAIQILATDLATDLLPSFARHGTGRIRTKYLSSTSIRKQRVMEWEGVRRIVVLGMLMAAAGRCSFSLSLMRDGYRCLGSLPTEDLMYVKATTAAYITIALTQMANLLPVTQCGDAVFRMRPFSRMSGARWRAIGLMVAFTTVPFFSPHSDDSDRRTRLARGHRLYVVIFFFEEARKTNSIPAKQKRGRDSGRHFSGRYEKMPFLATCF